MSLFGPTNEEINASYENGWQAGQDAVEHPLDNILEDLGRGAACFIPPGDEAVQAYEDGRNDAISGNSHR